MSTILYTSPDRQPGYSVQLFFRPGQPFRREAEYFEAWEKFGRSWDFKLPERPDSPARFTSEAAAVKAGLTFLDMADKPAWYKGEWFRVEPYLERQTQ